MFKSKVGRKRALMILLIIIIVVFTFFYITSQKNDVTKDNNAKSSEVAQTQYPLSFIDGYDITHVIQKEPQRIISLSPNITEILCDIGLEEKLVGRTDYCDYPESVLSIQTIGDISNPNLEKIVELNPDVIITDGMQEKEFVLSLIDLGIPVISLRANTSIEGTYEIIKNAGLITNNAENADKVVNNMKSEFASLKEKVKDVQPKKVFYLVEFGQWGLFTATGDTYINSLFEEFNIINIAKDGVNWSYSLEKLYEADPDIIICSEFFGVKDTIINSEELKDLTAVKENQVLEINNNLLDRQTERNVEGVKELVNLIYGK